jgi:hypothetical protein
MTTGSADEASGVTDGGLAATLSAADTQAVQRLTTLGLIYQARQAQLTRSAASIAAQQGSGSEQATAAGAAAAAAKATAARLAVVRAQITTPAPAVGGSGWALHGRVYSAQLEPAAGYCVFLVDAQKAYYPDAGFAYTDSTGYFLLTYPGTAAESGAPAGEAQPGTALQPPALYVEITNPDGRPVYLSTTALTPAPGTAAYQNFSLSPAEQPLGDPPPAIRAVALPPQVRHGTGPVRTNITPSGPAAPTGPAAPATGPAAPEHVSPTVPIKIVPAVPAAPPLRVRVTNSVDEGRSFALDQGELIIGREEGSAIRLQDGGVSHNHALLRVDGEDVTIEDLRSTNGTKVNGVPIDRQTALAPGDLIDVGGVQLVVEPDQVTGPGES